MIRSVSSRIRDQRGFTIVEVLVVALVLSVVLLGVYTALTNMQNASLGASERLVNLDESRLLMSTITKDLRTAARPDPTSSPFLYADGKKIQFYANLNTTSGPQLVTVFTDSGKRFVEETIPPSGTPPNYTYNPSDKITRVVGEWVANSGSVFRFLRYNPDTDAMEEISNGALPLTADQLLEIEAVEITLSIRRTPQIGAPPTTLINQVRLPNVDYNPLPTPQP